MAINVLNSVRDDIVVEEVLNLRFVKGVVSEIHYPVAHHNTLEIDLLIMLIDVVVNNSD